MCPLQIINDIEALSSIHGVKAHFIHHPFNVYFLVILLSDWPYNRNPSTKIFKNEELEGHCSSELDIFNTFATFAGVMGVKIRRNAKSISIFLTCVKLDFLTVQQM